MNFLDLADVICTAQDVDFIQQEGLFHNPCCCINGHKYCNWVIETIGLVEIELVTGTSQCATAHDLRSAELITKPYFGLFIFGVICTSV